MGPGLLVAATTGDQVIQNVFIPLENAAEMPGRAKEIATQLTLTLLQVMLGVRQADSLHAEKKG